MVEKLTANHGDRPDAFREWHAMDVLAADPRANKAGGQMDMAEMFTFTQTGIAKRPGPTLFTFLGNPALRVLLRWPYRRKRVVH